MMEVNTNLHLFQSGTFRRLRRMFNGHLDHWAVTTAAALAQHVAQSNAWVRDELQACHDERVGPNL